ncbi:GNAT family N-acetyltransferase [Pandoraea communis]|uniref:GNAT family N-acetyltransferase n=1 Tax=Pandoraea communis TaxID=2508297 RepID=UPI0025A5511A|nr:GNAT family N-acetyltransferase [Pandoraea communis]MDM8355005.1 GNAT family N-acetyltransferase [Pandoraea communis]
MITFEITDNPHPAYRDLAWDIFFRQRGRGLDLLSHFPWIEKSHPSIWCVLARDSDTVVGGLTVLERPCARGVFGIVGLVCVDASMRGQKIASRLTQMAIGHARSRQCGALTLWTGQPHFYAGQGFVIQDGGAYGWVTRTAGVSSALTHTDFRRVPCIATEAMGRGVPPFALGMTRIESALSGAAVTLVDDANGPTVAEWQGDDAEVDALFRAALPERFRLNCRHDDTLVATMSASGWVTTLQPSNLQMWRVFDDTSTAIDWDEASRLRLLDRI